MICCHSYGMHADLVPPFFRDAMKILDNIVDVG